MKSEDTAKDYAGLIAIRLDNVPDSAESQRVVSAALEPFASEPLQWESGKALARLRREGVDPTTSLQVLAIEQTLGAAAAIRDAFVGSDTELSLACGIEPIDATPESPAYWVRRQRMDRLLEAGPGETLCRREMAKARPRVLDRLRVHFEEQDEAQALRLLEGPATALVWEVGRWVAPYVEGAPDTEATSNPARRDIAREASPGPGTKVVLVLAEAWVGKSYVARQLAKALGDRKIEVHRTSFESEAPDWPDDAFLKETKPRVWIVDAVDEAERREVPVGKLGRSAQAKGLTTLVFTRPDATLPAVETALRFPSRAGVPPPDGVERLKVRLLPLDEQQIRQELAAIGDERLEALLEARKRFSTPLTFEELAELARIQSQQPEDLRVIRGGIARHRCTRLREGEQPLPVGDDDKFKAARLLAAIAVFSNEPTFNFGELAARGFAVNDVVPPELREAAHALRQTTCLFRLGSAWRFAAAHLEEDLAAGFLTDSIAKEIGPLKGQTLRALLTDGSGPRPELYRVIERAREGLKGKSGESRLSEALIPFQAGEAVVRFRAMLDAVRDSRHLLWVATQEQLTWLNAPPVRDEVRRLLINAGEPPSIRHLALRVAVANGWRDLAAEAARLAISSSEDPYVRQLAVVLAAGDAEQSLQVRKLLDTIPRDQSDEQLAELRAGAVLELLRVGSVSVLDAVRACPGRGGRPHVFDLRASAVAGIESRLENDGDAARAILDELRNAVAPKTMDQEIADELREAAVSAFLRTELHASSGDVDRLIYVIEDRHASNLGFEELVADNPLGDAIRREVYTRMDLNGRASDLFRPDADADWLIEYAGSSAKLPDNVHADLFTSIQALERNGQSSAAERGREILRRDGVWEKLEGRLANARVWVEKQKEWALARAKRVEETRESALPIERVVDTFLGDRRDASIRVHVLGDFFFGERLRGTNVVGTFEEDLQESTREQIMEATRGALREATPERIPDGNTFSTFVLDEGHAFAAAVLWRAGSEWLDASQVARWLPAALFTASMDTDSRIEDLIERCFAAAPVETRNAVIGDIEREARQGRAQTHRVPALLWADDRFRADLSVLIRRLAKGEPMGRGAIGGLLEALLAAYDTRTAPRDIRALLEAISASTDAAVSIEATRAWFYRWPAESVDRAIAATTTKDDAFKVFTPYFSYAPRYYLGARKRREELPERVVARVVRHILPLIPVTQATSPRFGGPIQDSDSLAEWRDNLVRSCIERSCDPGLVGHIEPELEAAIEAIQQLEPYSRWLLDAQARQRAASALESPLRPWPSPDQVVRMLRGALALIHDVGDLALVVAEILDVPWDPELTTLVYDGTKRAPERKLQVLLRDKLLEGLKNVAPPVEARLVREPKEQVSNEPDFVVITTSRAQPLEVPIEVKWSDNHRLMHDLEDQLGRRYLGEAGRTHGVYAVGWTGTPKDLGQLVARLQAASERQSAHGRSIYVVIKNLSRAGSNPKSR